MTVPVLLLVSGDNNHLERNERALELIAADTKQLEVVSAADRPATARLAARWFRRALASRREELA